MVTDPIADMLTRIRNANKALHESARMPTSKVKVEIARLLKEEGYIKDYRVESGDPFDALVVDLKYGKGVPVLPDTAQLKIYALAAADTFWPTEKFRLAHLIVVQPRIDPVPKIHTMPARALGHWRDDVLKPAIARINADDRTEKVGTYCRRCVRKQECETFKRYKSSLAADIFDDGVDILNT